MLVKAGIYQPRGQKKRPPFRVYYAPKNVAPKPHLRNRYIYPLYVAPPPQRDEPLNDVVPFVKKRNAPRLKLDLPPPLKPVPPDQLAPPHPKQNGQPFVAPI